MKVQGNAIDSDTNMLSCSLNLPCKFSPKKQFHHQRIDYYVFGIGIAVKSRFKSHSEIFNQSVMSSFTRKELDAFTQPKKQGERERDWMV